MASSNKTVVHRLLERAHSPDTANQIFVDKVQYRPQLLRPTSPSPLDAAPATAGGGGGSSSGPAALAAATAAAVGASAETLRLAGHDGREARRRYRRRKQEQLRQTRRAGKAPLRPKPLSARQRRALGLYDVPVGKKAAATATASSPTQSYATFLPLHRLWLGYIREVLGPELRSTAWATGTSAISASASPMAAPHAAAAIKLTAADFHGAAVLVTRSACVGRVGLRGIVVRDTRFVFQIVTPDNTVKMVPKEGTFFRIAIPVEAGGGGDKDQAFEAVFPTADDADDATTDHPPRPTLVVELLGSQFMHRAPDRANRKFKQHFYKEL